MLRTPLRDRARGTGPSLAFLTIGDEGYVNSVQPRFSEIAGSAPDWRTDTEFPVPKRFPVPIPLASDIFRLETLATFVVKAGAERLNVSAMYYRALYTYAFKSAVRDHTCSSDRQR